MADLSFTVPLAKFESEEWLDSSDLNNTPYQLHNHLKGTKTNSYHCNSANHSNDNINASDNFLDRFSLSLEDLVNSFDEKVTKCCTNFKENSEDIAPIQIRTDEQILSECPTWWTLTGNFGSLLPIDWDKTIAKKLYAAPSSLNTRINKHTHDSNGDPHSSATSGDEGDVGSSVDIVGSARSKANSNSQRDSAFVHNSEFESLPIETAEDVIKEINRILKDSPSASQDSGVTPEISSPSTYTFDSDGANNSFCIDPYPPYAQDDLLTYKVERLRDIKKNAEQGIEEQSKELVNELDLRDSLGYEKELKNTFITLLHSIQSKKRNIGSCNMIKPSPNVNFETATAVTNGTDEDNQTSQNVQNSSTPPLTLVGKLANLIQNQHNNNTLTPSSTGGPGNLSVVNAFSPGSVLSSTISSSASISSSSSMTNFADESSQRSSSIFLSGGFLRKFSQGSQLVSPSSQYLTTVIPYNHGKGAPDVATLRILIKILTAINNDDDQVPSLLTDYILKVICPSEMKYKQN